MEFKLQKSMPVKNVSTYLPVKTESNAHFNKNSNLTKKTERLTHGLYSNVTCMRVIFESNARGLLTVEDGSRLEFLRQNYCLPPFKGRGLYLVVFTLFHQNRMKISRIKHQQPKYK